MASFYKECKRMQERCVLLKRTHAHCPTLVSQRCGCRDAEQLPHVAFSILLCLVSQSCGCGDTIQLPHVAFSILLCLVSQRCSCRDAKKLCPALHKPKVNSKL